MATNYTNRTTILRVGIAAALLLTLIAVIANLSAAKSAAAPGDGLRRGAPVDEEALRDDGSGRVAVIGRVSERVPESSGVAVSHANAGTLWTHNDRGGSPLLYAIAHDGSLRATYRVEGVSATDWEDIALGPCEPFGGDGDCLYVADIGDNRRMRSSVSVHVIPEPSIDRGDGSLRPLASVAFRYPEGPTDAEALAVRDDGGLLVISKGEDGSARLYRLAASDAAGASRSGLIATREATLPIDVAETDRRVTGAALSPDARTLAVRTRSEVYLFEVDRWEAAPRVCPLGNRQPQGEAVDYLDDENLILTSEAQGARPPILRLRCP